jgi:hypothetical protein
MSNSTIPGDPNEFNGQSIVPVASVTIAISTIVVGMRFWSRAVILHVVGLEDWTILLALVCCPAYRRTDPLCVFNRSMLISICQDFCRRHFDSHGRSLVLPRSHEVHQHLQGAVV